MDSHTSLIHPETLCSVVTQICTSLFQGISSGSLTTRFKKGGEIGDSLIVDCGLEMQPINTFRCMPVFVGIL